VLAGWLCLMWRDFSLSSTKQKTRAFTLVQSHLCRGIPLLLPARLKENFGCPSIHLIIHSTTINILPLVHISTSLYFYLSAYSLFWQQSLKRRSSTGREEDKHKDKSNFHGECRQTEKSKCDVCLYKYPQTNGGHAKDMMR
jgi:hypothetical protein